MTTEWGRTEAAKEYRRRYFKDHPEKFIAARRRWNASRTAEYRRLETARYRARNPSGWAALKVRRRARQHQAVGNHTIKERTAKMDAANWRCFYCGKPADTMDHSVPLCRGGTNYIDNLVPACRSCNSRKRHRTAEEFMALKV